MGKATRKCNACEAELPITNFAIDRATKSGRRGICKICARLRAVQRENGLSPKLTTGQRRTLEADIRDSVDVTQRPFEIDPLPDDVAPIEEIRDRRRREFKRTEAARKARRCIPVRINIPGPIGILTFGDLHIDDPGSNFPLVEEHVGIVLDTEGMYAGSVGDLQNAWPRRLAHLWANQETTGKEAWRLCEWWVEALGKHLIWIVSGNHDAWARTVNGVDPIDWIKSQAGTVVDTAGVRIALQLPSGMEVRINCRHDFTGRSQYNQAHGPTKAAMFGGGQDDVYIAGHTHVSGYNIRVCPDTGRVNHGVRVASYKTYDDYAIERGFPMQTMSEAVVIMVDPHEPDERQRVWIEHNPRRAAKMLTWMREEWRQTADRESGRTR